MSKDRGTFVRYQLIYKRTWKTENKKGKSRKSLLYLKEYRPIIYINLLTIGKLNKHLQMIDDEANALYNRLIEQYKIKRDNTEELKEKAQRTCV